MARKKKTAKKSHSRNRRVDGESKLFAFLAVLLSILGFVIALLAKKDDKYVMFYAKQSLIIFLGFLISAVIAVVPIIGWIVSPLLWIFTTILWIIAMVFSLTGEEKETPVIGQHAKEIKV